MIAPSPVAEPETIVDERVDAEDDGDEDEGDADPAATSQPFDLLNVLL